MIMERSYNRLSSCTFVYTSSCPENVLPDGCNYIIIWNVNYIKGNSSGYDRENHLKMLNEICITDWFKGIRQK